MERSLLPLAPDRTRMASTISRAFPIAGAKGWFISVIRPVVGQPASFAVLTNACASLVAWIKSVMKAPDPHFMSKTKPFNPEASFFDNIDAVIRSKLSTVEVTSLIA